MPKPCKHERVASVIYRSGEHRRVHSTCQFCGQEWVVDEVVPDLSDTVTSDEQIEVHEQLAGNKTLTELIE